MKNRALPSARHLVAWDNRHAGESSGLLLLAAQARVAAFLTSHFAATARLESHAVLLLSELFPNPMWIE
jgi:hypothetical protein